jgi:hypothetical protein
MGLTMQDPGCCCGGCTVTICVSSSACVTGTPIPGALVTIKSGSTTVASGTTSSGGCVTLTIPSAGTYTVDVTATEWTNFSGSRALTCGGTANVSFTSVATGYFCCNAWPVPLPDTIFFTMCGVTWTLTYNATLLTWGSTTAFETCTASNVTAMGGNFFGPCNTPGALGSGSTEVSVTIGCPIGTPTAAVFGGYLTGCLLFQSLLPVSLASQQDNLGNFCCGTSQTICLSGTTPNFYLSGNTLAGAVSTTGTSPSTFNSGQGAPVVPACPGASITMTN